MGTFKIFRIILFTCILFAISLSPLLFPKKASAIVYCSYASTPTIMIDIGGQMFNSNTGDGSIAVDPGTVLDFTVYTFAEPSSPNGIIYPYQNQQLYPGPNHNGRYYPATDAITSNTNVNVWVSQNCAPNTIDNVYYVQPEASLDVLINLNQPATINVTSNISTTWSITGQQNFGPTTGTSASYSGSAGSYTISASDKTCYSKAVSPSATQSVGAGSSITFNIAYTYNCEPPPSPATINVQSNIYTSWTIVGPSNFSGSGTSASYSGPAGSYTITADNLANYTKSVTPSVSQSVSADGAITFTITYVSSASPPVSCSPASQTVNKNATASISGVGGSGSFSWSASGGSPSSGSGSSFSVSYSTTGTKTVTVTSGGVSANCYVEVSPGQPQEPQAPTCTSSAPQSAVTSDTSGTFYLYAYGVENATSVYFPTWSNVNGQDDIVWYPGTFIGNNTWRGGVNLASHRSGNPDYGLFNGHVYMNNETYANTYCGAAYFTRETSGATAPIGYLDAANCSIIGGWTFDSDTPNSEIQVDIYYDGPADSGTFLTNMSTSGLRPDVNAAFGISGNHGFTLSTYSYPELIDNDPHTIYAYGINNNGTGPHTLLTNSGTSGTTVQCAPSAPSADIKAGGLDAITIGYGTGTTISWGSENVSDCTVTPGGWTGTSGSQPSGNLFSPVTYSLNCTGQWGTASDSVVVSISSSFNYSLSNSGNLSVTKAGGDVYAQNTITKTLISGTTQPVTLSLSGVPSGTSYSISNSSCSPTCSPSPVITFTITPSTPAGTHPIIVTGSPLGKTTSFNLIVYANPVGNVSCVASPQPVLLGQTVTWTASVSGGTPPYTYSWSGTNIPTSPAPTSNPYTKIYSTIGQKSAQATVRDSDGLQSTCPVGTVQVNFNPEFEEF